MCAARGAQHGLRPQNVRLDDARWMVDCKLDTNDGSQMYGYVSLAYELLHFRFIRHARPGELESRISHGLSQIVETTRGEVVEHVHPITFGEQRVHEMRTD